jgi:hypothetical protein
VVTPQPETNIKLCLLTEQNWLFYALLRRGYRFFKPALYRDHTARLGKGHGAACAVDNIGAVYFAVALGYAARKVGKAVVGLLLGGLALA